MPIDSEIDRLYQLAPDAFTAARNALASQLKKAGDAEGAARVKALAKPSMSAWAVNQLYWRVRPDFDAVVTAGDVQRLAEQTRLAGGAADVRAAGAGRDRAIARALKTIDGLAAKAGVALGPPIRQRIKNTLEAIATDGSARQTRFDGRLIEDVTSTGFAALAALAALAPPPAPAKRPAAGRVATAAGAGRRAAAEKARAREADRARARAALAAAESDARALRGDADRAARELADAEARAVRAREDVDLAKRQLADAMARATRALDEVKDAKKLASKAAAAASAADASVRLARSSLARLER